MLPRFPLLAKILAWLMLNLMVLALAAVALFNVQFHLGLDSLLAGRAGERLRALGAALAGDLQNKPVAEWDQVLQNFGQAYQHEFLLFRADGTQVAGAPTALPEEVRTRLVERRGPGPGMGRGPGFGRGMRAGLEDPAAAPFPRFVLKTRNPTQYWTALRLPLPEPGGARPWPLLLLLRSNSLSAGGLFIDFTPWVIAGFGAMLFSVLLWLPLVRGVTRALSQMTSVTEQIAQGNFEAKVQQHRRDELGRLGQAINSMAARLSSFVTGQKRFLGDVAHELCSPLARIQVALGILEERADEKQKPYVDDVREEVQNMSALIDELLSFSRAGLAGKDIVLGPVELLPLIQAVVRREAGDGARIEIEVPASLKVTGEPQLLSRAIGNLLRNAIRYAGAAGPIRLSAAVGNGYVDLLVQDQGPGVPEESLQRIFDPFFRAEASRSRATGGIGLGLTIVKTCVEACQGSVQASNRKPHGLEIRVRLKTHADVPLPKVLPADRV